MRPQHARNLALVSVWFLLLPAGARAGRDPLTDSLDIAIPTPAIEFENAIFASPLNSNVLLLSNRGPNGATSWISETSGLTWTGSSDPVNGTNRGEPSSAITRQGGANGRFFVSYRTTSDGVAAGRKDNPGSAWTPVTIFNDPLWAASGNHIWPDNRPSGQYAGWIYDGRVQAEVPPPADPATEVWMSRSLNNGEYWPDHRRIHPPIVFKRQGGVNLHTGPSGEVYAAWTVIDQRSGRPEQIAFKRSLSGGDDWHVPPGGNLYIQSISGLTSLPGKTMAVSGYPSMAVNQTNGEIYVVWMEEHRKPDRYDAEVYFLKSTDEGATWSGLRQIIDSDLPELVNKDQWHPWITWDACTGMIAVVFLDSRNSTDNTSVDTYVAVSEDGGTTWSNFRVSDTTTPGDPPSGFVGDHIGIAAADGKAFPVWSDERPATSPSDKYYPYISPFWLWGIYGSSVSASYVNNLGNTIDVTASWITNLAASAGDQLVLISPTGTVYTSPLCTTCAPNGKNHSLTFANVPCEPGYWSYYVISSRSGCTGQRRSDTKTFRVTYCLE